MSILLTGGAGYIGSHVAVELIEAGYDVVILDNLSNSTIVPLERVSDITGEPIKFYHGDVRDRRILNRIFREHRIDGVIHCAGLKSVSESIEKPMEYYDNNLTGTLTLLEAMREYGVKNIIFSSSATVYGEPETIPITEECPKRTPTCPYGRTKTIIEDILTDLQKADPSMNVVLLRYFNPIGAHESGLLGEVPTGIPNNLVPYVAKVALGEYPLLNVYGDDYPTKDGTGVRDYIHIVDLAQGHVKALKKFSQKGGLYVYNLGTGNGYSVLEVLKAYEKASGRKIPYRISPRRGGDIAVCYCDATKAKEELGWQAKRDLESMCVDSWRFTELNPSGYNV